MLEESKNSEALKDGINPEYWNIRFYVNNVPHKEAFIGADVYAKDGSIRNIERINDDELHMRLNE